MRRRAPISALLAAALAAGSLTSAEAARPGGDSGKLASRSAWVKLSACPRGAQSAVFYARMRRLADGQRMWMRFTLLERGKDGTFAPVEAPGLGRWRKSKPGVTAFGYRQRVRGLAADSAYRARVDYRWYGADGELAGKARRRSGVCSETGPLPNLRARIFGSAPTELASVRRYTVRVANSGELAATDVDVRLAVDGSTAETKTVTRLDAGQIAFVNFRAPQCTNGVTAEADPADAISESSETDNSQRLDCADIPQR